MLNKRNCRILASLAVACATCAAELNARESRTVSTAQGPVRGYKNENGVFHFYGIPYATVPKGTKKFSASLPGPVWTEPLEAVENNIICPQIVSRYVKDVKMQEDCLVANVYVPDTDETNLPVLVYVHGGAYFVGYGTSISLDHLMKIKKLIAVTFNYRLGPHGFLCLGTEDAPGNAGMKDQVALLRWVKKNIASFGGNPDDVTIAGGSAGSSSVDLLMLSKMSQGLFNKVIPESGSSLSAFTVQMDPLQSARDYAKLNGFNNVYDISALQEYYESASWEELTLLGVFFKPDSSFYFSPCLERDLGQEMFLNEAPIDILKEGKYNKVPVLTGCANMEGLFAMSYYEKIKDKMNERFADFLPADLQFSTEEEKTEIANKVKGFYFGDQPIGENTIQGYIDFESDILFAYSQLRTAYMQMKAGSEVYLYEYSFYSPGPEGLYPEFMKDVRGAGHVFQSIAIYECEFGKIFTNDSTEEYETLRKTLREMWVNFITTGKPVPEGSTLPEWPPLGANRSPYMEFGQEVTLKGQLLGERARLWDEIYEHHYRAPAPPTAKIVKSEL